MAWLSLAAAGCGGIAEGRAPAPEAGDEEEAVAPGKGSDQPGGSLPEGDTALGDCKLGAAEHTTPVCPWVADRRCYATREMACNCACPRSRDSVCSSGFENGPSGHVVVSCD